MLIYAVSKNSGPTWTGSDPFRLTYLGSSLDEAEKTVDHFKRYEKPLDAYPTDFPNHYSALPSSVPRKLVKYYMADGWWYVIEEIEFN